MTQVPRPKKIVDPRLIKPRRDPTIKSLRVPDEQIPYVLYELITNSRITLQRALNYSKVLNTHLCKIEFHKLLDLIDPILELNPDILIFYGSLDPGSFKVYSYWYSRFLNFVILTQKDKYKIVADITLKLIKYHLLSEGRRGLQPGTIRSQLSSIKHMLHCFSDLFPFLYCDHVEIKKLFNYLEKIYGRPVNKKEPVTYYIMYKILDHIDFLILIDVRDWFLMVLAHIAGFRGVEVGIIKWTDLVVDNYFDTYTQVKMNILMVFLDSTKTETQSSGAVVTISIPKQDTAFNLLLIMKQYIKLLTREGFLNDYVFPSLRVQDRSKNKHINTATIRQITKKRIKQIGLDPKNYGAHSYRVAFVHDAVAAGIPEALIKKTGRWKSQCWVGYFHDAMYAQAQATSRLNNVHMKYENKKSQKKHRDLLLQLDKKLKW